MKISKFLLSLFLLSIIVVSCNKDDEPALPKGDYENGILIANEGPFGSGSGTVTYISNDFSTSQNSIYKTVNSEDLGNILQSLTFNNESAYLIANVSKRLVKVNRYTFEKEAATIEDLNNPRYAAVASGKLFVTNWGDSSDNTDDYVAIFDAETLAYDSSISVDFGPEKLIVLGNNIYVAHKGGYGYNNKISVIDIASKAVTKTIEVGDVPSSLVIDNSNNLWVLCGGKPNYAPEETYGTLEKINTSTYEVTTSFDFVNSHPSDLSYTNGKLYYQNSGGVYVMGTSSSTLPSASIIADSGYSVIANDDYIYVTDAKDYMSSGEVRIYNLDSKQLENTISTGIIPGGVYFN
jgi:YVTN family beta-propeller protein